LVMLPVIATATVRAGAPARTVAVAITGNITKQ